MELWPAIDVLGGRAVRLVQGDFARCQDYGEPLERAHALVAGGAERLHVVDLDAARDGVGRNRGVIAAIAAAVGVPVEAGGGVRTEDDLDELLDGGAARVVLGTAALEEAGFLARCATRRPGHVVLGLDYRRREDGAFEAASRGWRRGSGRTVGEVMAEAEALPLAAVVVTAIERDGTLRGPDLAGVVAILEATELPLVASGGVGGPEDLVALAALRAPAPGRAVAGVIVGTALLNGTMSIGEATRACAQSA
jgi:phosphoribosylformimino-5-aminoimidazole carboxamide ribotide isomerase